MPKEIPAINSPQPLAAESLYNHCDASAFAFGTTAELAELDIAVGQQRALSALEFGVRMTGDGYNLFVLGPDGSHQRRIVKEYLESLRTEAAPSDWCYVNNFNDERKPIALRLPARKGATLKQDVASIVDELLAAIPAAFESEHYRNQVAEITQEYEEKHRATMEALQQEAQQHDVSLVPTPHGFAIAPMRTGKLLSDKDFEKLSDKEKDRTTTAMEAMTEKLRAHIEELPEWHKQRRERIRTLDREVTELAIRGPFVELTAAYRKFPEVLRFLEDMREDVLAHAPDFQPEETRQTLFGADPSRSLQRYQVNVVVEQPEDGGVPIVYESNPTYQNLLGRIEHVPQFGALVTDFSMIRPGALHKANGGFLILDADRLLTEPYAWTSLKRTLFEKAVRMESLGQQLSLVTTVSLEPDPIPLDCKVILLGSRVLYFLLCELDPDFQELFKVAADFENRIDRTDDNIQLYGRLIATLAQREGLLPLTPRAVARIIEHSSRLLGDAEKLSTRLRDVSDLIRESDYWARRVDSDTVHAEHVQVAIDAQIHRLDRLRSEMHEEIQRDDILIDTQGTRVGQVNGLSVIDLGRFSFGQPSKITANVSIGDGKIVDIERETELGGPIHSKGVLILSAYVSATFAPETPLSFAASLVFEQSYGGVEGDSATIAETCALLSALANAPIRQTLAVTGSMNQHGTVQVIGGVNEKIEGFFDICRTRGLTGDQGVLIPADNAKHLMLRADVVEAARNGQFAIYPVATVDEALALLTGIAAGQRDEEGQFPEDSINGRVEKRLIELAELRREFDHAKKDETESEGEST
ncbi:MAG: AAA family ATPase [Gammaproteobacteria bacterium]|nr:AAA family ATPase [Gammaproteobacteria bacterium]